MAAMEARRDVPLESSTWMSCKILQKLVKFYLLWTLLAMVKIFQALQWLWAALFPSALLWWNVMLYAPRSKYCSWNYAGLRLEIAGTNFCGHVVQDRCSHPEAEDDEDSEKRLPSSHERESCVDASQTDKIDMCVFSLFREGTSGEAVCFEQESDGCSTAHEESQWQNLHHGFDESTYCGNQVRMLNPCGGMASAFLDVSPRPSVMALETTLPASDAQALAISSQVPVDKLSSLRFLDRVSLFLDISLWMASSVSSQHRVPPLAMLDVSRCLQSPVDVNSFMQANLLDLSGLLLGACVSVDMPVHMMGILSSCERNRKVRLWGFLLSTTISGAPSADNAMVSRDVRIIEEPCAGDSDCVESRAVDDDEGTCSATMSSNDELNDLDEDRSKQSGSYDGHASHDCLDEDSSVQSCASDGHCSYNCYVDSIDRSVDNSDYVHDVEETWVHPGMSKADGVYDLTHWNSGYYDLLCVKGVEDPCRMDGDSEDENAEGQVAFYDGIYPVFEDGLYENPVNSRDIHVAELNTWWDEGAVFIDKEAREEEDMEEPEWEMVEAKAPISVEPTPCFPFVYAHIPRV